MSVAPHRPPLQTALRALAPWLLAAVTVAAVAMLIRLVLIEPLEWALACEQDPGQILCLLRSATIATFQQQLIGWLAAVAALAGMVTRWPWLAGGALLTGTTAAVLYAVEPGLFGALLGLLGLLSAQTTEPPITTASNAKPSA